MLDDSPRPIRFEDADQPELEEFDAESLERQRLEEEERRHATLLWLDSLGWRPFGDVW